ncbi:MULTISPECIES: transglutaminase-like domain-containing protein [Chryseobacterium]|uniref:Transglutaminase superfamily protein n=1 Tax=Chryseobacterium geocarposphaerae TaxID=1416776 RepID=A0ABU1LGT6_9FLAO|nr:MULTISPECIES: transglutaminase-like domain-containing protein [Chryseobacterium]MDR6405940.1 hypothetical protein [Chryseobacterium geocarposphaerae]MDR6699615.1 hypothetical protein [Chryseobacterium ginsenosidimutans]
MARNIFIKGTIINFLLLFLNSCDKNTSVWTSLKSNTNSKEKKEMIQFLEKNSKGTESIRPVFFKQNGEYYHLNWNSVKNENDLKSKIKKEKLLISIIINSDISSKNICNISQYTDHVISIYHQNPWRMHIPKSVLYNNLLPYKIYQEDFSAWYPFYIKYFSYLNKKIPEKKLNRKEIDSIIWNNVKSYDTLKLFGGGLNSIRLTLWPGINEIKTIKSGDCQSISTLMVYLYRFLGIPATIDFTPYWGGTNSGHSLPVAWDSDLQKFTPIKGDIFEKKNRLAKAFRISFKLTNEWSKNIAPFLSNKLTFPIESIKNDHWEDVTDQHSPTNDIIVEIPEYNGNIAYISVYSFGTWKPIFFGKKIEPRHYLFKKMARDVIYRCAYMNKNEKLSLSQSIIHLDKFGKLNILNDVNNTTVKYIDNLKINKTNIGSEAWIKKNTSYTLCYLNNNGEWSSIKTSISQRDSLLVFNNIPIKKVYILKNNSSNKKTERPFMIKHSNVVWF